MLDVTRPGEARQSAAAGQVERTSQLDSVEYWDEVTGPCPGETRQAVSSCGAGSLGLFLFEVDWQAGRRQCPVTVRWAVSTCRAVSTFGVVFSGNRWAGGVRTNALGKLGSCQAGAGQVRTLGLILIGRRGLGLRNPHQKSPMRHVHLAQREPGSQQPRGSAAHKHAVRMQACKL